MSAIQPILTPSAQSAFLAKQARAFLADRVIEQAAREQVPLSDIEKRMLTFSETMDDEPDNAASRAFDEQCDEDEYEAKVAGLLKRAYARDKENNNLGLWKTALRALRDQDCYILVMVDQARLGLAQEPEKLKDWIPERKDLLLMLVLLAVFVGGGYVVFFRLNGVWTKWVGFAVWMLAMWGVTRVGERQI